MKSDRIRLMLRALLLAFTLVIPCHVYAAKSVTKTVGGAELCSDYQRGLPTCGISKADKKQSRLLYDQAIKLSHKDQFEEALDKLKEVRRISPHDRLYSAAEEAIQERAVAQYLRNGNKAMLSGDADTALTEFRKAIVLDPSNEYAQQRLGDALPVPEVFGNAKLRAELGETRLVAKAGVQSFEFKGGSTDAIERFAKLFGITTTMDQGVVPRNVRIKLDNVTWETGSQILQRLCKVIIVPLTDHGALVANDTAENRSDLIRMSLRTFYARGGSTPQELTELSTALHVLFDLRFITPNPAQGAIVIRAPQQTLDAVTNFLEYLQDERPGVMLDIRVFEVSTTLNRDLGISAPDQFTVFNIPTELQNLVSSSSYQQILAALQASGQTVNATTILAALLASSSSSSTLLTQPFGTFGGGLTLSGVTVPTTTLHFTGTNSVAQTIEDVQLRSGQGKAATLKIGSRYPIVTSEFSATSSTVSSLSALGLGVTTGSTSIPSPQFSYEDLGLVLKATPQVHGKLVSLEYEFSVQALGPVQPNGLPLVTKREMKGTISTEDGGSIVMAGLIEKNEMASMNGIPVLSVVPLIGPAFSVQTKQNTTDELLVVMTPHISEEQTQSGSYIPIPTNVPK